MCDWRSERNNFPNSLTTALRRVIDRYPTGCGLFPALGNMMSRPSMPGGKKLGGCGGSIFISKMSWVRVDAWWSASRYTVRFF